MKGFCMAVAVGIIGLGVASADEAVRRVQEELRRRNLFFGDVDGKVSPELVGALRIYQTHKGFDPTGRIDDVTARSLDVTVSAAETASLQSNWPDVPVLKSDAARALPPAQEAALVKSAVQNIDATPAPEIASDGTSASPTLELDRATHFIEDYLRDGQTNDIAAQVRHFDFPCDYFDHGLVDHKFVEEDTRRYVRRWPKRSYRLNAPVKLAAAANSGETLLEFPLTFDVRNNRHHAAGKTRNFWTVRIVGSELKIVAIKEQHLHD